MTKARLKIFYLNGNVRYLFPFAERCSPFLVDDDVKAWRGLYRLTPAATRNLAVCGFTGGTSPVVALYDLQSALNPTLVTSGRGFLKEQILKHIGISYINLLLDRRIKLVQIKVYLGCLRISYKKISSECVCHAFSFLLSIK